MLAPKFVEAAIKEWLQEDRPVFNPVEFYPVLARKIVEALKLYEASVLDYNGPKKLDFSKLESTNSF